MTATRDITCDLIERPPASARPRATPHAEAIDHNIAAAESACHALTAANCLIERVSVTPDRVLVRLERCPSPGTLGLTVPIRMDLECGQSLGRAEWRGVIVEWPLNTPWRAAS